MNLGTDMAYTTLLCRYDLVQWEQLEILWDW